MKGDNNIIYDTEIESINEWIEKNGYRYYITIEKGMIVFNIDNPSTNKNYI
jgi:hypothetical protein